MRMPETHARHCAIVRAFAAAGLLVRYLASICPISLDRKPAPQCHNWFTLKVAVGDDWQLAVGEVSPGGEGILIWTTTTATGKSKFQQISIFSYRQCIVIVVLEKIFENFVGRNRKFFKRAVFL